MVAGELTTSLHVSFTAGGRVKQASFDDGTFLFGTGAVSGGLRRVPGAVRVDGLVRLLRLTFASGETYDDTKIIALTQLEPRRHRTSLAVQTWSPSCVTTRWYEGDSRSARHRYSELRNEVRQTQMLAPGPMRSALVRTLPGRDIVVLVEGLLKSKPGSKPKHSEKAGTLPKVAFADLNEKSFAERMRAQREATR